MAQHFITKCSCGAVIAQCRCPDANKSLNIVERGCARCHTSKAKIVKDAPGEWMITDDHGRWVVLSQADIEYIGAFIHESQHGED